MVKPQSSNYNNLATVSHKFFRLGMAILVVTDTMHIYKRYGLALIVSPVTVRPS